jgi:hypothetical protein
MYFVFLDEFGHIGPYVARNHRKHNTSPVFGLGGLILPENSVRNFATFFLQLKSNMLAKSLADSGMHPAVWEKKGTDVFKPKNVKKYRSVRDGGNRLLNRIKKDGGFVFYYGIEKHKSPDKSNSLGLHKTVLTNSLRQIDKFCGPKNANFMVIMDEHSSRMELLEASAKTMFGSQPAKRLLEPPFQVESHLYQTVQAGDWLGGILGKILTHRVNPQAFPDYEPVDRFFGAKLSQTATHSRIKRAPHQTQSALII